MKYLVPLFVGIITLFTLIALSTQSFAGGTSVLGVGVRAETLQAFTAVADDPSAIYYNPAGITQIKGNSAELDVLYVGSHHHYRSAIGLPGMQGVATQSTKKAFAPDIFITSQASKRIFFGIGLYAPFARTTDFTINGATYFLPMKSEIVRLDVVPTMAFILDRHISVGFGLVLSHLKSETDILGLYQKSSGEGLTGQVGILIKPCKGLRIGANFRGPEDLDDNGYGRLNTISPYGMPLKGRDYFTSTTRFPGVASVGVAWQITPSLLGSAEYDYEFWHRVHAIIHHYSNPLFKPFEVVTLNPRNSSNYRFGLEYRPSSHRDNAFRFGYAWIGHALPANNLIPAIADYSGDVYALGYSRYFHHWRLDLGYEHADSQNRYNQGLLFPGKYDLRINTFMVGAVIHFA